MVDRLEETASKLASFVAAREGWTELHTPKNLAMALAAEAGELLAELQWLTPEESEALRSSGELRERVRDELADVFIYLQHLASRLDIDLLAAVEEKHERNEHRFPVDSAS